MNPREVLAKVPFFAETLDEAELDALAASARRVEYDRAATLMGDAPLYITSANRSRHLTGADEEPAHWRADGIAADFDHVPELAIIAHRDEAAARATYPRYLPTSVTLLSFHALAMLLSVLGLINSSELPFPPASSGHSPPNR